MASVLTRISDLKSKYDKVVLESQMAIENIQNIVFKAKEALKLIDDCNDLVAFKERYFNMWDIIDQSERILIKINLNFGLDSDDLDNKRDSFRLETEKHLDSTLQMDVTEMLNNDLAKNTTCIPSTTCVPPTTCIVPDEISREKSEYNYRINLLHKSSESCDSKSVSDQKVAIQCGPPTFHSKNKKVKSSSAVDSLTCSKQQVNKGSDKSEINNTKGQLETKQIYSSSSSISMQFEKNNFLPTPTSKKKSSHKRSKVKTCQVEIVDTNNKDLIPKPSDTSERSDFNTVHKETENVSSHNEKEILSRFEKSVMESSDNCLTALREIPSNKIPKVNSSCIITYYESPSCFYIMVADEITEQYDFLHETLDRMCQKKNCFQDLTKIEIIEKNMGLYFACYLQTDKLNYYNWHRCKVIDWFLDSKDYLTKLKVIFLDEGFESVVDISDLCSLPAEAYAYSAMAQKCYLAYIYPPGSTPDNILEEWPPESIDIFKEILLSEKSFKIVSCEMSNLLKGLRVDLVNEVGSYIFVPMVTRNVASIILPDEMVDSNFCFKSEFMKNQINRAQGYIDEGLDQLFWPDKEVDMTEQISEAIEGGYTPRDQARICKFTDISGKKCFKGNNCRLEHGFMHPDGWTTDKQFIYSRTNQFCTRRGLNINLIVTHIVNGTTFYACNKPDKTKKTTDVISLRKIAKLINDPERVKTYNTLRILPSLGELVLAEHDQFLYRARVVDVDDNFIEVFFIDYGNKSLLKMSELREIQPDMIHLPEQACLFRIVNIEVDEETEVKAEKFLRSEILDSNLLATVCDETDSLIEAFIFMENGIDVGQFMIDHKLAKTREHVC